MSELIKKILEFFGSKAVSLPKKMIMSIAFVVLFLLIDNLCGFSYYFVQSYKLDYITSLESARTKYAHDKIVSQELDRMMVNALNRWTVYNAVSDIFQKTFSTTSEAREQKLAEEITNKKVTKKEIETKDEDDGILSRIFPVAERSPFWHTVCSSLLLIVLLAICVIFVICSPFVKDKNKKDALLGMCVIIPLLIGVIYMIQWLLSFIPDIDGRPRINNTIFVCVNVLVIFLLINKKK
jgi:hypothetical protein